MALSGSVATPAGVPAATTRPPASPPPGPRSITQSAVAMVSRSCSTRTTVLPASTRRWSCRSSSVMSAGCRPDGRLVEQVERVPATGALQLGGELDALRLAAAQLGRRLTQPEVAQAHVAQRLEAARGSGYVGEELRGVVDRHGQHVGDGLAAVRHLERLGVVARPVAGRARCVGAGQEQQLDGDETLALAGLAAALCDVEGEPAGAVAARPAPRRSRRRACAPRRTSRCTSPGWTAGCGRSAAGRPAPAGRTTPARSRRPRRPRARRRPASRAPGRGGCGRARRAPG